MPDERRRGRACSLYLDVAPQVPLRSQRSLDEWAHASFHLVAVAKRSSGGPRPGFEPSASLHHATPFDNPELAKIIGRTLTADQTLTDPSAGIAEKLTRATAGLTTSVGQAAGAIVSAPLALVDPDAREDYGDQIDALTQSVQDAATLQ